MSAELLPNEQPAATLTIEQLVNELTSRPEFSGVVAWKQGEQWQWRGFRCNHGHVFLHVAHDIICNQPGAELPPAISIQTAP